LPTLSLTEARVGLSDEDIVRPADQLFGDPLEPEGPALLNELTSTIPAIAKLVEGMITEASLMLYLPFVYHKPSQ
jgi:hypothetical protein